MTTENLALSELTPNQSQPHLPINEALSNLDALVLLAVESSVTAPVGMPAEGQRYRIITPATGAFAGQENKIAHYRGGAYRYYTPFEGWMVWDRATDDWLRYSGAAWEKLLHSPITGWTRPTGTAQRTGYATYTSPAIAAVPTQAEVQAIADSLQDVSRTVKALIDDVHQSSATSHGLLKT